MDIGLVVNSWGECVLTRTASSSADMKTTNTWRIKFHFESQIYWFENVAKLKIINFLKVKVFNF